MSSTKGARDEKSIAQRPQSQGIHKDDATSDTPIQAEMTALDMRMELIQALIPLGLEAVAEELQNEVTRLTGDRYTRKEHQNPNRRWGSQQGSVKQTMKPE